LGAFAVVLARDVLVVVDVLLGDGAEDVEQLQHVAHGGVGLLVADAFAQVARKFHPTDCAEILGVRLDLKSIEHHILVLQHGVLLFLLLAFALNCVQLFECIELLEVTYENVLFGLTDFLNKCVEDFSLLIDLFQLPEVLFFLRFVVDIAIVSVIEQIRYEILFGNG